MLIPIVPVCGCIILSSDMRRVVLVKSFKGNSWSFPKGKMDRGESQYDCAIREVYEECGFDCSKYLKEKDYIEMKDLTTQHMVRLYIASGIDSDTAQFKTLTRKEIGAIEWFPIRQLPGLVLFHYSSTIPLFISINMHTCHVRQLI
jgi:mRNA-decapping enzyme subunit 2